MKKRLIFCEGGTIIKKKKGASRGKLQDRTKIQHRGGNKKVPRGTKM